MHFSYIYIYIYIIYILIKSAHELVTPLHPEPDKSRTHHPIRFLQINFKDPAA
jgi:hypothetical protein